MHAAAHQIASRRCSGELEEVDDEGDEADAIARFGRFKRCRDEQGAQVGFPSRPTDSRGSACGDRPYDGCGARGQGGVGDAAAGACARVFDRGLCWLPAEGVPGAGVHRGLPSRHMTLIVSIGAAIDVVSQTDPAQAPRRFGCVVGGLQASPALIAHDGDEEGVAIELTPVGSRALFGMPARELWNTSLELDEIAGPVGRELWERLQEAVGWGERFAAVDELLCRLVRDDPLEPALRRSWQLVTASGGTRPVADVARTVGWTRQQLRAPLRRRVRPLAEARGPRRAFRARPPDAAGDTAVVSIAQVAAACGYYDQAHLNHDSSSSRAVRPAG